MKKNLYVLYDKVAKLAGPVFEAKNDETAQRSYNQFLRSTPQINPRDYELYRIANFDDETMEMEAENEEITVAFLLENDTQQEIPF